MVDRYILHTWGMTAIMYTIYIRKKHIDIFYTRRITKGRKSQFSIIF